MDDDRGGREEDERRAAIESPGKTRRENKTRQDKARQGKARQGKTG